LAPAEQGDQIAGCSPEQAALAVAEAAAMHGPRWGDPTLSEVGWISSPSIEGSTAIAEIYAAVWPGFVERYRHRLDAEVLTLGERFGAGLVGWAARRLDGPLTGTHGDFRIDNLLFAPDGGRAAVVDWQTPALGIGTDDVSYLLGAGLLPADRRAHEHDLVRGYHDDLVRRGVADYPWERCWDDYVRFSLSGLQMAVVASMIVRQDDRGDEMFCCMAERHAAQALELGADRLLE
ncbi:MAG TPA: phosphotransferase, partial [Acidimicrobiales bacterium]|nr:phosphotransferase [Acidimicrobiales bacterium]